MSATDSHHRDQYWLRPLRPSDIHIVSCWYEEVEDLAMFHQRMPIPLSAEAIDAAWRDALLEREPRTSYWFMLEDDERRSIGMGGIENINYAHGDALAPFFICREGRKKGLAIRLRAILLDLAFNQLSLARVTSVFRADNIGSQRVNEACGFSPEGCLRNAWRAGGESIDVRMYGLLASEWREHRLDLRKELSDGVIVTLGRDPAGAYSWPPVASER